MQQVTSHHALIVFMPAARHWWQRRVLRKGYGHAFLVILAGWPCVGLASTPAALLVDRTSQGLAVDLLWQDADAIATRALEAGASSVVRVAFHRPAERSRLLRVPTCVSTIEDALGWATNCGTPWRLRREAIRRGGVEVRRAGG